MNHYRIGAAWRIAACAVFGMGLLGFPGVASAASATIDVGEQPVIKIFAKNNSSITVRSWERPQLNYDSDDEALTIVHRAVAFGTIGNPLSAQIPMRRIMVADSAGGVSEAMLPPEDFPYSGVRAGMHDSVQINASENSHTTVTVPANTAILVTNIGGKGSLAISDYRGANFFAFAGAGSIRLAGVTSTGFVQLINGTVYSTDSTFERLRARTNRGELIFERCRTRQIEATTVSGAIVYDDGGFDPGLARFESTSGNIALGIANNAQLSAQSKDGRVFMQWERRPTAESQRSENDATAIVGAGGAFVNALTAHGNVFLYDGSIAQRRGFLPPEWRPVQSTIVRRRMNIHGEIPESTLERRATARRARAIKARISATWRHRA